MSSGTFACFLAQPIIALYIIVETSHCVILVASITLPSVNRGIRELWRARVCMYVCVSGQEKYKVCLPRAVVRSGESFCERPRERGRSFILVSNGS